MDVVDAIALYHSNLIIYTNNNYNNFSHANLLELITKPHPTRW